MAFIPNVVPGSALALILLIIKSRFESFGAQ
jgi:hypothetical protein